MKVYDIVKDRLLNRLVEAQETGERFAWVKPWSGGCPWACNYLSQRPYRGINALLLSAGEYLTYRQIEVLKEKDPSIRRKEESCTYPVFFFKFRDECREEDPDKKRSAIFRYYRVFSIDDVVGVETKHPYNPVEHTLDQDMEDALCAVEVYARQTGLFIEHVRGSARAFYAPGSHTVHLPDRGQFKSMYDYFSTCFHEVVHSTAPALGRNLASRRATADCAAEELVAEIGAAMLCAKFRVVDDRTEANSAAYIQSWMSHLTRETGQAIVSAAQKAQKACDLICGEQFGQTEDAA